MDSFLTLIVSFVLGIVLYWIDVKRGLPLYLKWYNLTHKDPIDQNHKGFIHLQSAYKKLIVAAFIAGLYFLSTLYFGGHPLQNILVSVMMTVGLMIGFYIATPALKFLPGGVKELDNILKKADEVEQILHKHQHHENPPSKPTQTEVAEPKVKKEKPKDNEDKKEEDKDSWRDGIDDFLKK